jgi:hypothetical protein
MATPAKTFTLIKGQEITIDLNQIYINDYEPIRDVYLNYGDNFVIGNFRPSSLFNYYVRPSDLTITQSANVNTLNYPLSYTTALQPTKLYNGTDYVTQIKVKINTAGTFILPFDSFFYKGYQTGGYNINFTFNVVEPPPPLVYNNAGIVYNKYDRVIRVEKNKTTEVSFGTDGLFPNGEQLIINSTLPAWITNNTIGLYTQFWTLSPTSTGTFYYNASAYLRNTFEGDAAITVIVVDSLFEEIDNCCSDENVNIVWLNRQGGRGNFIFTQRKDFNVEIGKKSTYLTNDIKRYSEIKNVHNGFKVYSTGLSLNQIDFLDTLRYSIQCWQYINGVFIPLILDIGSFEKYNTKENMYEISMNFLYAERLNIQRQ